MLISFFTCFKRSSAAPGRAIIFPFRPGIKAEQKQGIEVMIRFNRPFKAKPTEKERLIKNAAEPGRYG